MPGKAVQIPRRYQVLGERGWNRNEIERQTHEHQPTYLKKEVSGYSIGENRHPKFKGRESE